MRNFYFILFGLVFVVDNLNILFGLLTVEIGLGLCGEAQHVKTNKTTKNLMTRAGETIYTFQSHEPLNNYVCNQGCHIVWKTLNLTKMTKKP